MIYVMVACIYVSIANIMCSHMHASATDTSLKSRSHMAHRVPNVVPTRSHWRSQ